jgi:hypothetical protein
MGLSLVSAMACTLVRASEAPSMSIEEEVAALKGSEFGPTLQGAPLVSPLSCTLWGSGQLVMRRRPQVGWDEGVAKCGDRFVLMLMRFHEGKTHFENRWRIVDAVLLPEVDHSQPDNNRLGGRRLYTADECFLDRTWGTALYAVVNVSEHKRMDWRTGVIGAWGFDLKRERIVPISTKRVVCHKPEPD